MEKPKPEKPALAHQPPVMRTEEDRNLMADAIWEAQAEPLQEYFGPRPPPFLIASALSLATALRAEHPEVSVDQAMASAARTVTAYIKTSMCARRTDGGGG